MRSRGANTIIDVLRQGVRLLLVGLVIISLGAEAAASSGRGATWDGTWAGGWESGDGVQIVFVGQKLISFYRGDYRDIAGSQLSADARTVTFAWAGGEATLQRIAEDDARIALRERGRPERSFAVKRE